MAGNKPVKTSGAIRRISDRKIIGAIAYDGPKKGWDQVKRSIEAKGWFIDIHKKTGKAIAPAVAGKGNTDG